MGEQANIGFRCVIVEDEVHNSRMLLGLIAELRPRWKVQAVLESVEDSVDWLQSHPAPDLLLMDIQLSDGLCFAVFDKVALPVTTKVIFVTAYDEYAIRAFKVNSIDYLLKPVERQELRTAFLKFESTREESAPPRETPEYYAGMIRSILEGRTVFRTRFLVPGAQSWRKLDAADIAYVYSENKLTFAVGRDGGEHRLEQSLEQLESELNPREFFRANRKLICSAWAVDRLQNESGGRLLLFLRPEPSFEVIVSRLKASEIKDWLGK
ncbi:MAG: LytTR family DNA-binding domain-containing protein [Bacteroidales bacterium]